MQSKIVFEDIGTLMTLSGVERQGGRRPTETDLDVVTDGVIESVDGRITWSGAARDYQASRSGGSDWRRVSLGGRTVIPAFVECHTHTVFAGQRWIEFEWRMQGQTYQEIAAKGGGILSTVRATRAASEDELLDLAQTRADRFLRQGVTLLEVKSGYGLSAESEFKCLRVAGRLRGPRIVRTFLGAHSKSPDFPDLAAYTRHLIDQVLPQVARDGLAERADIYIEKGFFDLQMGRAYLRAAKDLGLALTAHVEQLSEFGGTDTALDFQPQSVDHVVYANAAMMDRLAGLETVAVLLPASDLYLKMRYPPARDLIDRGARFALSTDFNPGTSPTQDLSLVGLLARLQMGMTLPEVITAFTWGAAQALGQADRLGSLTVGKLCDFSVLSGDWRELFYAVGHHPVNEVYMGAQKVV